MKRTPPPADERVYLATCAAGARPARRSSATTARWSSAQSDPAAAAAFADDLARDWPGLQGVVGALAGCEAFARRWRELTGRGHALRRICASTR